MNWEVYPTTAIYKSNFLPSNLMVTFSRFQGLLSSCFERDKVRSNVCGARLLVDCFEFDRDTVSIQESDQNASNNTTNNRSPLPCPNCGKCFCWTDAAKWHLKKGSCKNCRQFHHKIADSPPQNCRQSNHKIAPETIS